MERDNKTIVDVEGIDFWGDDPRPYLKLFSEVFEVGGIDPASSKKETESAISEIYSKNPEIEEKAKSHKLDVLAKTTPEKILFYSGLGIAAFAALFGARVLYKNLKEKKAQKKE